MSETDRKEHADQQEIMSLLVAMELAAAAEEEVSEVKIYESGQITAQ